MRRSLIRNVGYVISLCLFAAAMVVLHRELRHYHYADIVAELKQVKPALLAVAALCAPSMFGNLEVKVLYTT